MNKRMFLKSSAALLGGGMLSRLLPGEEHAEPLKNWSGNYTYSTDRVHYPKTVEEVQHIVKNGSKLRALGTRHSFNSIADTTGDQVSSRDLAGMVLNRGQNTVTVGAGVKYGQLAPYLQENGFALHNLASLPHISVAGACATGTHGSGIKNGNLSTAVAALEFVSANGEVVTLSRERDGARFQGAVVGLGGSGLVTKVTLKLQPAFDVSQVVYENLSFNQLENHLEEIFSSGYSVSLFTDWQHHRATQVWIKSRVTNAGPHKIQPAFFGAKAATQNLHPLTGHSAENCTEQMGVPGPWYERLPHFRMNFTPSSGAELQTEYFVPRQKAYEAILAVETLRDQVTPHLFITELRTIDADDLWMSPCYKRASLAIHFTWKPEWDSVKRLLPLIEERLAPFAAKPHWAKLFTMAPSHLQAMYGQLPQFKELLASYDPNGKFRNEFLARNLYGS